MALKPRTAVCVRTTDDWCPSWWITTKNYPNDGYAAVEVSFLQLSTDQWRVCVWGADDMGMDRDFPADQRIEAEALFLLVIQEQYLTRDWLIAKGFAFA